MKMTILLIYTATFQTTIIVGVKLFVNSLKDRFKIHKERIKFVG